MEHLADDPKRLDLFLAAALPAAEEAAFEEHLIECAACREKVDWAERFRSALRAAAAEDAAHAVAAAGVLAGLARWRRLRRWTLLVAAGLLAVAPGAFLWMRQGRLEQQIAQLEQREALAASRAGERERRLTADLERERAAAARLAAERERLARPAPVLLVALSLLRSGSEPQIRLDTGRESRPATVLLSIDLPPDAAASYGVTLLDAAGRPLWQGGGISPSLYGTLLVSLPSGFLSPGSYRLRLEAERSPVPRVSEIPFRILPLR